VPLDDDAWAALAARPEPHTPETPVVMRALARLKPSYREVVTLKHVNGMAYAEIAEFLGLSISSVESLLFKARKALRVEVTKLASHDDSGSIGATS
jgi:RNA polymerase sigma-70 factor (ECF subfamily)